MKKDTNNTNYNEKISIIKLIKNEFIDFFLNIKQIFENKETILIWVIILPINIVITIINIFIGILNYLRLCILFFYKFIKKKLKHKNIKPIKSNKKIIMFNNYILQTIYFLTFDLSLKKSFMLFYNQLYILINFKKNIKNNKENKEKIKYFFGTVFVIIIKRIFYYITLIPFFILKNNNEITLLIYDIKNLNCKTWEVFLSTLFANLIKNYNLINTLNIKKLKIKFNKKNIYLNPLKALEIINSLKEKHKLTLGTKQLINSGRIATIRYHLEDKIIKGHPSLLYNSLDIFNDNKPTFLAINQSTKRYLNTGKIINEYFIEKTVTENELKVKGLINNDLTAFNVTPHLVHKELTEIISSKKLIYNWGQEENWIKQFNLVQSFLVNLENKMLFIDKQHGILIDTNYKHVRDYIEKNYLTFSKETQKGLENIIDFYDKNKIIFENSEKRLNFIKCLWLAEIDPEIKEFFNNIIDKNL